MIDFELPGNHTIILTLITGVLVYSTSIPWEHLGFQEIDQIILWCYWLYSISNLAHHIFSNQQSIVKIILEPYIPAALKRRAVVATTYLCNFTYSFAYTILFFTNLILVILFATVPNKYFNSKPVLLGFLSIMFLFDFRHTQPQKIILSGEMSLTK